MDFKASTKIEKEQTKSSPCDLSFYLEPPDCSVSLQEFEDKAVARLKLLRIFERVGLTIKERKEWKKTVDDEISQAGLDIFKQLNRDTDELLTVQKYDHVSHYILRLAFCRTEELRRWFVNQEIEFFRYKFEHSADGKLAQSLLDTHFQGTIKPVLDKPDELIENIKDAHYYLNESHFPVNDQTGKLDLYEVPFTQCLDLVRQRRTFLQNGKAYIVHKQLFSIVCSEFRRLLSRDLATTSKFMHIIDEDERLAKILQDFDKRHTGSSYSGKGEASGVVTVEKLEETTGSFPLCVKSLYDHVKTDYHLRHFGRLQLGLFFKGVGVPLEQATRFWRTYFTKKQGVDDNKFDKQYLYNIRHMYGQEGKRADYTPYSCMKIIMSSVGPGESHGCPFRHSDGASLRGKLAAASIPPDGVKEIMELVEKQHYQIACQKYFEWTHHKATVEGGVNHPNQYYEESIKTIKGEFKIKTEAPKVQTTRSSMYATKREIKTEEELSMELNKDDDDDIEAIMSQMNDSDVDDVSTLN